MISHSLRSTRYLLTLPVATLLAVACGGTDFQSGVDTAGGAGEGGAGGSVTGSGGRTQIGSAGKTNSAGSGHVGGGSDAGASVGGAGHSDGGSQSHGGTASGSAGHPSSGGASAGHGGAAGSGVGGGGGHLGSGGASGAGASGAGASGAGASSAGASSAGASGTGSAGTVGASGAGGASAGLYLGPTVGSAKPFAVLAYSAITTANISAVIGDIGVSAGAVSTITGFDLPGINKYGIDSLAPNSDRTILAQQAVSALVGNIDPRPCDADYTSVVGGLTGDVTLYPGVTCMNSFTADVLLNGHVTLDARGNSNAFFIIRGNLTLTVADAAQVVLSNGAEACGVFWRIAKQVTIGKAVQFYGTVITGSALTMSTSSTLLGRALAQTAGVHLDANAITIPSDGLVGAPGVCTHVQ